MLGHFDWLSRCQTGAELLATVQLFAQGFSLPEVLGEPYSALFGPCQRCWVYAKRPGGRNCRLCHAILARAARLHLKSRRSVVIWAYLDGLYREEDRRPPAIGAYRLDAQHALTILLRHDLKPWLQGLVLEHGSGLKGVLQIFPTAGMGAQIGMGDLLARAVHHESYLPRDSLWVRFFARPSELIHPHVRDREGLLTFSAAQFVSLLTQAQVFRAVLRPEEQRALRALLAEGETRNQPFYWGRFAGMLDARARDMLEAWNIRRWPEERARLLYELVDYVPPPGQA
jgi:hypothetical protein